MRTWAIANQKGGVGKTTTAVSLAGLLAQQGERTLLVDMDPQGSLTSYFGLDPDSVKNSLYSIFKHDTYNDIDEPVRQTVFDNLFITPASTALSTLDRQLGGQVGMGLILKKWISQLNEDYQQVIIDCPPVLGVLMINALAACDHLIIPVQTEFLALKGLERMLRTLSMVTQSRSHPLPHTIIPTMFDRRTRASIDTLSVLRERHQNIMWDDVIPVDTQFREASRKGAPISQLHAEGRGLNAYKQLLEQLLLSEREAKSIMEGKVMHQ